MSTDVTPSEVYHAAPEPEPQAATADEVASRAAAARFAGRSDVVLHETGRPWSTGP